MSRIESGLPTFEAEDLVKVYGDRSALNGVSLRIEPGEILALLGHNGAGKTTFARLAAGLAKPTSGTIRWQGTAAPVGRVSYVGQEVAIYPRSTVAANLTHFAELDSGPANVDDVASGFDLGGLLSQRAGSLSGGQKRRLHAAIGFLGNPALVLLDEPTAGADVATRQLILDYVKARAAAGTSICYTSHISSEIDYLDPRVAVLAQGRVVATGSVSDIVASEAVQRIDIELSQPWTVDLPASWRSTGQGTRISITSDESLALFDVVDVFRMAGADVISASRANRDLDAALVALETSSDGEAA